MPFNGVLSHLEEPLAEGLLGEAVVSSVTTPYGMLPLALAAQLGPSIRPCKTGSHPSSQLISSLFQ